MHVPASGIDIPASGIDIAPSGSDIAASGVGGGPLSGVGGEASMRGGPASETEVPPSGGPAMQRPPGGRQIAKAPLQVPGMPAHPGMSTVHAEPAPRMVHRPS